MLTALCARPVTSSTPGAGHAEAITTKNVHDKATASDNNSEITKCGWSSSVARIAEYLLHPTGLGCW
jgi:hypothetical protein